MRQLENNGWRVMRIWEHEVKRNLASIVQSIAKSLRDSEPVSNEHWAVITVEPTRESTLELCTLRELRTGKVKVVYRRRNCISGQ